MKFLFSTIILCASLFTGFISCNYGQESTGLYTLKMRLKPGDTFKQDMDIKIDGGLVQGNALTRVQSGADFEVMEGDSVNKLLKITYTHLLIKIDKNMIGLDETETDSIRKQNNDRIKGKSVIVKLGPGNKIIEVTGLNESFPDSLAIPGDEDVKAFFDKEELNNTFGMMLGLYPEKPVKKGESWNVVTTMGVAGLKMSVNRRYTLQSVKDGMATITFEGKLAEGAIKQDSLPFSIGMNGTHSGTIQINLENGYVRKADFKLDAKGEMEDEMSGQKTPFFLKIEGTLKGR